MVAGYWNNPDGLVVQYGTQKAVPEVGGDFLVYGANREVEFYVPLVPWALTSAGLQVPAAPTSFSGTTTAAAAGITSLTTMFPLQTTAPVTASSGGVTTISNPQLFIEAVEVETLIAAVGGTSVSVGLAVLNGATGQFVQVTPNAGVQLVNAILTANINATGKKCIFYQPGSTTDSVPASIAGGGSWIGNVPLVTNAIVPLPQAAYISSTVAGTFTDGLLKVRVRYNIYGNIGY